MPLAGKEIDKYSKKLNEYALEIKKIASKEWTAKFMPNLKFVKDESFEYAEKIENLLLKDKIRWLAVDKFIQTFWLQLIVLY